MTTDPQYERRPCPECGFDEMQVNPHDASVLSAPLVGTLLRVLSGFRDLNSIFKPPASSRQEARELPSRPDATPRRIAACPAIAPGCPPQAVNPRKGNRSRRRKERLTKLLKIFPSRKCGERSLSQTTNNPKRAGEVRPF